ncbi:MAG: hypothetical protein A2792_15900 [Sphingomonadales bacterium RIFCSPHIGHO2_01_FULL_65_20]|jgi:hypothetical protein|uniref:Lipoprotein n=1 Tax=Novosphingobium subterraneum TaxID=48936 RepID=A0A0B9A2Q8_9SPHN|nr:MULTISPECIES: hypothetical protein [Sphingomonadaceae]MAF59925.1 hypothetical protein [Blastomonas sp.]MBA3836077.1 hypothetical protein [Zymomonas sp.]OHC92767.1 MAG: hypothetical protein A2792_15900 [Sphingomonadales bacterium RIFCSPHIGHO2_01_FULL_65_20]KHS49390.1 hypothetical protein NJ75_00093 [Novosphingobium subterraneum]KHS49612.1 hypothetical protein NJ75_00315 [Novosphingobium subterraneum]|tara:strand:- start:204 stop:539 length:336 start_codon:yes stop_codon:yes gene_type:complete
MAYLNRKALSWTGFGLALAGALALSACNSKDKEATPSAAATDAASETGASDATNSTAADDMHNRMEADQRQKMDHDSMRMGPGMNHPATPAPDSQPTNQSSSMPSGGMQDM